MSSGLAVLLLAGCSTFPEWIPSTGPSRQQVIEVQDRQPESLIQVVSVTDSVARRLVASQQQQLFSQVLASKGPFSYVIGPGDVLEVSIWEAPPAVLFGASLLDPRSGVAAARSTAFPEQMVSSEGTLSVPFAGSLPVANKTPQEVEREIGRRLSGKANQPQVLVRVIRNATSNVTVVGEVAASTRMPLTARGERLLDALAAAGGVRQPVGKVTLQLTRGEQVHALALETIIRDPKQNITLQPGDVITALFQPLSFTVLGATAKNEELNFEAQGITLAQALGRIGGLQDRLADARAVYIFRFENPAVLDLPVPPRTTPEGKVPVVYEVNLKNPETFFVAQGFPVQNKDVLYVANAPGAELQKFLGIIMPAAYSVLNTYSVTK
ncbi:MAG TPA: polysaccharide biosynthesis/export family protein [Candidatus Accumulibacter phosphatis]|nr:capsular biosynthesis protein [Accumulibacter sp.]HCN70007.1 capsular biosynthesis protein [Accumulibacter sp.]HCV14467.1 capsular biosynthesis protein [Accumulibacter sp.]HRQ94118.1 polysaccharide biosynthesis/export family protein [Candidatus Accumulibacter phosphatis]